MKTIYLDDRTLEGLSALAKARGLTVEQYLTSLVNGNGSSSQQAQDDVDFDAELDRLTFHGPALPGDFSRADIYADHD